MTAMLGLRGATKGDGAYDNVLKWVLFTAVMVLATVVAWDYGLLQYVYTVDHSRISVLITVLFLGFCGHCLWILIEMAREYRQVLAVQAAVAASAGPLDVTDGRIALAEGKTARGGIIDSYLRDLVVTVGGSKDGKPELLLQSLAATLRRRTKVGTYAADLLYKLGMLGTMVGFVMMLNSMGDMSNFDVETLRAALQKMIAGMAVSLLTTIAGLIGGLLLRIQYNLADALATDIVQAAVQTTETALVPRLPRVSRDV